MTLHPKAELYLTEPTCIAAFFGTNPTGTTNDSEGCQTNWPEVALNMSRPPYMQFSTPLEPGPSLHTDYSQHGRP